MQKLELLCIIYYHNVYYMSVSCSNLYEHIIPVYVQKTRECLPPDHVNEIWEAMKDYGVLVGKGGFYGNVS